MSLYKNGEIWYYDFVVKGKRYCGSTGQRQKSLAKKMHDEFRAQRMPDKGRLQCVIVPAQNTHDSTCVFNKEAHPRNATEGQGWRETDVAKTLNTFCTGESRAEELIVGYDNHPSDSRVTEASGAFACLPSLMGTGGNNTPLVQELVDGANVECYPLNGMSMITEFKAGDRRSTGIGRAGDPLPTITANHHHAATIIRKDVACPEHPTVRRITPVETERLMGFPDNWTRIPWRGKPAEQCPDGPRYKACGNSMCVNCMEWIGERIEKVERALQEEGR